MTDEQRLKQLQALHRQQEQEMRQKLQERKLRTRRLCIIGGAVVRLYPELKDIPLDELDQSVNSIISEKI